MPKHPSTMPRRSLRTQRGQAVTEFAVILPVLLLVLLAIYQFGVVFNNYIQVTAAARAMSCGNVNRSDPRITTTAWSFWYASSRKSFASVIVSGVRP